MKVVWSLLFTIACLLPYFGNTSESNKKSHNKKSKSVIGKRGRYKGRGGIRFRFYVGPRYRYYRRGYYYRDYGYYYHQVTINIREDVDANEKILNAYIDGYSINLRSSSPSGNRGSYSYRLNQGYHNIEWSVESSWGKVERYNHNFYIDRYNRYTNILIDGDQIFIN